MSEVIFVSKLKPKLEAFLEHKRKFGIPYKNGAYYLADFDRYYIKNYPEYDSLEKAACLAWAVKRPSENASGFTSRITPLRQFGKYLVRLDHDAFILPDKLGSHTGRPIPHIFSEEEIANFFKAADNLERYYQSVVRHFVAPVMFRFLYCCGLRPQEARNILVQDVNFETGKLFIRESKGLRERIVILPDNLVDFTKEYLSRLNTVFANAEFLFPDRYGAQMQYGAQNYLFEICMCKSGIISANKPTLYSFRHSYATHRLYKWIDEGKDISAKLPYLSAFMGHSDFSSTAYYIHLVPDLFKEMSGMDLSLFEELIPEVTPE